MNPAPPAGSKTRAQLAAPPESVLDTRSTGFAEVLRLTNLSVVILGGLLVFQGSSVLDGPKLLYVFLFGAALLGALLQLSREGTAILSDSSIRPWLWVALSFAVLVAISLPVAIYHGTPLTAWLRDAAPYAMFAAAPVFGAQARHLPVRLLVSFLVAGGLLAAASFAIEWIQRRGIADLPIDRLVLPTGILASTLLAYASARALVDRRWLPWAVVAGSVLGLFLVTGTRSTLLLLAVPAVLVVLTRAGLGRAFGVVTGELTSAVSVLALVLLMIVGPPTVLPPPPGSSPGPSSHSPSLGPAGSPGPVASEPPRATARPDLVGDRFEDLGGVLGNPASDASVQMRIAQTLAAARVFLANPIAGTGPGSPVTWALPDSPPESTYTLDTPLIFLAKFGLVGLAAIAALLLAFWRSVGELRRRARGSAEYFALLGFGLVFAIAGLLNSPFEDKGLSFATILILAITFRAARAAEPKAIY